MKGERKPQGFSLPVSPDRKRLLSKMPGYRHAANLHRFYPDRENGIPVPVPVRAPDPELATGVIRVLGCTGVPEDLLGAGCHDIWQSITPVTGVS